MDRLLEIKQRYLDSWILIDTKGICLPLDEAEKRWLISEVESLRQQAKTLEDKIEEWRNECMNLRQQLASHGPCHGPEDCPEAGLQEQLATSKEEVELNKKLYEEAREVYAFSVQTQNDLRDQLAASEEEVERWKAMISGAAAVCTLDSGCQFKVLQAQLARMREALEAVIDNHKAGRCQSHHRDGVCNNPLIQRITKALTKKSL